MTDRHKVERLVAAIQEATNAVVTVLDKKEGSYWTKRTIEHIDEVPGFELFLALGQSVIHLGFRRHTLCGLVADSGLGPYPPGHIEAVAERPAWVAKYLGCGDENEVRICGQCLRSRVFKATYGLLKMLDTGYAGHFRQVTRTAGGDL